MFEINASFPVRTTTWRKYRILKDGSKANKPEDFAEYIEKLRSEMLLAAEDLEFEKAAEIRDRLVKLEAELKRKWGGRVRLRFMKSFL